MKVDLTHYEPLPSQDYLHKSDKTFKGYFGGFGSGKSQWLCYEVLFQSCKFPNNYYIIMRRTYNELDDTILKDFMDIIPEQLILKWDKSIRKLTLINKSVIVFRSFDAIGKIFSYNLGGFAIDQAEELPEDYFLALVSRMRKANIPERHGLLSLNPAGHNWTWRRFIRDKKKAIDHDYVVAKTDENIYLPAGYVDQLRRLFPPQWVARYVDCEFTEFEGLVYDKFKDENILNNLPDKIHPRESTHNIVCIDIGIDAPTAVLFTFWDTTYNRLIVYDEIYERNLTIKPICTLIKARLRKWDVKAVWKFLIDPDAKKRQQTSGRTVLDDFRTNGIPVVPADNNVDYGILRVNELMSEDAVDKYKKPVSKRLLVLSSLVNFFEEIYDYIYDIPRKNIMEGIDSGGKPKRRRNHLMDDIRYIVLSLPLSWTQENYNATSKIYAKYVSKRFEKIKRSKPLSRDVRRHFKQKKSIWLKK